MGDLVAKENFDKTCRVCLTEGGNMKSLFTFEHILETEIQLSDILMTCSSITIEKDVDLPDKICYKCSEKANIAYLFRKLCESSDSTLRELSKQFNLHRDFLTDGNKENAAPEELRQQNLYVKSKEIEDFYVNIHLSENFEKSLTNQDSDEKNEITENDLELPEPLRLQNDSHSCAYCSNGFVSKKDLLTHIKQNHKTEKQVSQNKKKPKKLSKTCDICNKIFRFHSNLERHKLVHTREKPYLCNICGKSFAQAAALKIHAFTHTGRKPYKCQICTQGFGAPGTLTTHLRTHTGERPHVCKICGKQFPQAGYLTSHVRTHTGEKPIECQICGQRFNQSSRLTTHMRIHSGERPYQCEMCKRRFAVKGTLKKHIRTHTGERPYSCKICNQSFAQNGTLSTHLKVHRPKLNQ